MYILSPLLLCLHVFVYIILNGDQNQMYNNHNCDIIRHRTSLPNEQTPAVKNLIRRLDIRFKTHPLLHRGSRVDNCLS